MKRTIPLLMFALIVVLLAACGSDDNDTQRAIQPLDRVTANDLQVVAGQTVFVPAYSEIFHGRSETASLTVTLAIHNTDADNPIVIRAVRYYNTVGDLVRDYVDDPLSLQPLGTTGFVIADNDQAGGFGANFIVEWIAETPVTEPVIEGIMIDTSNQQGLSLITTARILEQIEPEDVE